MLTKSGLSEILATYAKQLGLELYDLDLPRGARGVLRVYVSKGINSKRPELNQRLQKESDFGEIEKIEQKDAINNDDESDQQPNNEGVGRNSITHQDCVAMSRLILDSELVEDLLPGECRLEVSSPGINRKLKTKSHFMGAVGERIRVRVAEGKYTGQLESVSDDSLVLRIDLKFMKTPRNEMLALGSELLDGCMTIKLDAVESARVDYEFL